jgi:hypothetical protein
MKAREKNLVHVFMSVLLVFLFSLTCTAYAAPSTTQKSTQQTKSATGTTSPASMKYDPNAPPQGTITIPASTKGNVNASTWYTGSYQYIQWTCNGTYSKLVDVTLWQNNRQVATIWTRVATGQTAYVVPLSTVAGSYEVRVTSEADTRIEARLPVNIVPTTVTLTTPQGVLLTGSPYTITWTYTGNMQSVKLLILDSSGAILQAIPNISAGSNGQGRWPWTVPTPAAGKSSDQYRFQISATFRTSATSSANTETVLNASDMFTIAKPSIQVGRFMGWQYSPSSKCQITWTTNLIGGPVKVELYSVTNSAVVQTIQASVASQASNALSWSPPANLPANLYGTSFRIKVTSLTQGSVQGSNDPFIIAKPSITLTLPDPNQTLVRFRPYEIAWNYKGDPGAHVKIEIYSAFNPDRRLWSIADSSDIGLWGVGHFSWNGDGSTNLIQMYIQIQSIETPSVKDRRLYNVVNPSGATVGTSMGGGSSSSGTGSSTLLTRDTSFNYNASSSATFQGGTTVNLDAKGYAVKGYLTTARGQSLDYRSGKSAQFQAGSFVTFSNGYVVSGFLSLGSAQSLDYRSGKSASFMAGSLVAFRSGGYVKSAFVGAATTFETTKGTQSVPALSSVTFDDNGYLASFNPPGFLKCYKCDKQVDPTCSNSGGLPPCK